MPSVPLVGSADPLTDLRARFAAGELAAGEAIVLALEDKLRAMARRAKGRQRASVSLQTQDIVNEAVLKLMRRPPSLNDDKHFLAYLAGTMRCVLIDYHRQRSRRKRAESTFLEAKVREYEEAMRQELPAGEELLQRLREVNPLGAEILFLSVFGEQPHRVIAEVLELSLSSVEREARRARLWLRKELERGS